MSGRYGSSSYSTACFSGYRYNSYFLADYANIVVFLAVYIGILVTLCVVRRKTGPGKQLLGLPYMLALVFMFIEQTLTFLSSTLQACYVGSVRDSYNWQMTITVFSGLATFLLLFVVLWTLNTMLRKRLGHNPAALKITLGVDLFVLGSLQASLVVLVCYMISYASSGDLPANFNYMAVYYVAVAFWAVYLGSILASAALSLLAVRSLRKKHIAGGSLMIWVSVLYISLFAYSLIMVIQYATALNFKGQIGMIGYAVMYWVSSLTHALAHIAVIAIASNVAWRQDSAFATGAPVAQEHDAYNYQQDPVYNGANHRV